MAEVEHERIVMLEAEVKRLKKANQHWHERQPERDELAATVEHMDEICHTRETRIVTLEAHVRVLKRNLEQRDARVKELDGKLSAAHHTARIWREKAEVSFAHGNLAGKLEAQTRVKAADDALFLAIKNKEKAEDDERLGRTRIAALEALGKELDQLEVERITSIATLKARVKELTKQTVADQGPGTG